MFITMVGNTITGRHSSIEEVSDSFRTLDPAAAAYIEVFELVGSGVDVLNRVSCSEKGEGITPGNLSKYRRRIG